MPCGGIYYFGDDGARTPAPRSWCLHCRENDTFGIDHLDHFCEEWDGFLHSRCVVAFLKGDMGETVIDHMHTLELGPTVNFSLSVVAMESVDQLQIASATEKT